MIPRETHEGLTKRINTVGWVGSLEGLSRQSISAYDRVGSGPERGVHPDGRSGGAAVNRQNRFPHRWQRSGWRDKSRATAPSRPVRDRWMEWLPHFGQVIPAIHSGADGFSPTYVGAGSGPACGGRRDG
jgi:hypothetical protein